jgi:hypothetical protein
MSLCAVRAGGDFDFAASLGPAMKGMGPRVGSSVTFTFPLSYDTAAYQPS